MTGAHGARGSGAVGITIKRLKILDSTEPYRCVEEFAFVPRVGKPVESFK